MTNFISGCQGAAGIEKTKVMKATCAMTFLPPAGDDGAPLNSRGLTWEPVMSTCMRARTVMMHMQMRRKKHCKPIMNQRRIWRTEGIVGSTWEPVMLTGMSASMVTMRMRMRRNKHRKLMMDQCRMWRTKGIVLESVKIRLCNSDL